MNNEDKIREFNKIILSSINILDLNKIKEYKDYSIFELEIKNLMLVMESYSSSISKRQLKKIYLNRKNRFIEDQKVFMLDPKYIISFYDNDLDFFIKATLVESAFIIILKKMLESKLNGELISLLMHGLLYRINNDNTKITMANNSDHEIDFLRYGEKIL